MANQNGSLNQTHHIFISLFVTEVMSKTVTQFKVYANIYLHVASTPVSPVNMWRSVKVRHESSYLMWGGVNAKLTYLTPLLMWLQGA